MYPCILLHRSQPKSSDLEPALALVMDHDLYQFVGNKSIILKSLLEELFLVRQDKDSTGLYIYIYNMIPQVYTYTYVHVYLCTYCSQQVNLFLKAF